MILKLNSNCQLLNTNLIYEVMSVDYCLKLCQQRFFNKWRKCKISEMNMFWPQTRSLMTLKPFLLYTSYKN